jgi:hypothetical protein
MKNVIRLSAVNKMVCRAGKDYSGVPRSSKYWETLG